MASPLTESLRRFLDVNEAGVLAVHRRDGSIHQSVVRHVLVGDSVWISTEGKRLKGRAVARDGWASYCVHAGDPPFAAVSLEGPARIHREGIAEITGRIFSRIFGRPVDPPLTDEGLAAVDRVLLEIVPSAVYASTYIED